MKIWIVQAGESVSWLEPEMRPGRCNLLAHKLVSAGHEVVWWTSLFSHSRRQPLFPTSRAVRVERGFEIRLLRGRPYYRLNVSLRRLLHQRSLATAFTTAVRHAPAPSVVFACLPTPELADAAVAFAVEKGIPTIVDVRDPWPDSYLTVVPPSLRRAAHVCFAWERRRVRRTLRRATAITAVSQTYLDWALGYAGRNRAAWDEVFPLASALPIVAGEATAPENRRLRFVFAGSLSKSADLDVALDAAERLQSLRRPDIEIAIAGSGEEETRLRARARGLSNVRLLGWLSQPDLERLLATSDVALALYSETALQSLPNKVFDYLATGLPIISSLRGEFAAVLRQENVGVSYEPGNAESLARRIIEMADDAPGRLAMRRNCFRLARERYDPQVVYGGFAHHIETITKAALATQRLAVHEPRTPCTSAGPRLRVWIVQMGELIPGVDGRVRDYRYGLLAQELARRGHEVVRWSSTFNHISKTFRCRESRTLIMENGVELRLLHAMPAYRRNIAIGRVIQQRRVAAEFLREAGTIRPPDVIVAGIPVPELAEATLIFARPMSIPVVIDVQDLWPDIYVSPLPSFLRAVGKRALAFEFSRIRRIMRGATAITSVSQTYHRWALDYADRAPRHGDGVYPLGFRHEPVEVPSRAEREAWRKELGIIAGHMVALFTGSFGASYDIATLGHAARILQQQGAKVHLVVAGDGEKMGRLRRIVSGLPNVTVPGWVDKDTVRKFSAIASAGICAYTRMAMQSIPYKPIEYLAAGLPIVSSLQGEMHELLRTAGCGLTYTPSDPASLAQALAWIAEHDLDRAAMARASRELFERYFDATGIYPALGDVIEALGAAHKN